MAAAWAIIMMAIAMAALFQPPATAAVPASPPLAAPAGLTYMASFDTFSVWEDLSRRDGPMSFFLADNTTLVLELPKRDVDAAQLVPAANQSCCGYGFKIEQLTSAGPDLLGRAVLDEAARTGDDPDETKIAAALPPFTAAGQGGVAAFVGSRKGPAYGLRADGTPSQGVGWTHPWRTPYFSQLNTSRPPPLAAPNSCGILGGFQPILRWTFDEPCGPGSSCAKSGAQVTWEQTILGAVKPPSAAHQSIYVRWIRYAPASGELLDEVYIDTNQPYPSTTYKDPIIAAEFYREVLKTANSYTGLFGMPTAAAAPSVDLKIAATGGGTGSDSAPMVVSATDPSAARVIDQSRHSLVREWIARRDEVWGAYGVLPDQYGGSESDGFQENLNSGVAAAMAWGFFGTARQILSSYWQYMVRPDGKC